MLFTDADPDMNDRNSPNVFQLVPFLSGYRCVDTDTQTWNSSLTICIHKQTVSKMNANTHHTCINTIKNKLPPETAFLTHHPFN